MAKQETISLRRHLASLLRMKGAHVGFEAALAGLPPELRGAKPPGAPHSPWQLLEHMRIAQEEILDFSRNPEHRAKPFPDGYWPATETPPGEDSWDASIERFHKDLKDIEELVADTTHDLLARIPHGTTQTLLQQALLAADHNSYHLGQLVLLRMMLEPRAQ